MDAIDRFPSATNRKHTFRHEQIFIEFKYYVTPDLKKDNNYTQKINKQQKKNNNENSATSTLKYHIVPTNTVWVHVSVCQISSFIKQSNTARQIKINAISYFR